MFGSRLGNPGNPDWPLLPTPEVQKLIVLVGLVQSSDVADGLISLVEDKELNSHCIMIWREYCFRLEFE